MVEKTADQIQVNDQRSAARYIFFDVVSFSTRPDNLQYEIVMSINRMIRQILNELQVFDDHEVILIPTGDGMCMAYLGSKFVDDIHLQTALRLLALVDEDNQSKPDTSTRFDVRIGIHQGIDISVTDINGRANVAGSSITLASRIMDKGDGGNILVSDAVYEVLRHLGQYADDFRRYDTITKHSLPLRFFQYTGIRAGVNPDPPSALVKKQHLCPHCGQDLASDRQAK